jgi:hypothetical protein
MRKWKKEEVFDIKEEVKKSSYCNYNKKGGKRACKNRSSVKKPRSK